MNTAKKLWWWLDDDSEPAPPGGEGVMITEDSDEIQLEDGTGSIELEPT